MNASTTSTNLLTAHHEWKNRPADERHGSLESAAARCREMRANSKLATAKWADLSVGVTAAGDPVLVGKTGGFAALNNYSFEQLARQVKAPAKYLTKLPGDLAAECLNESMAAMRGELGDAEARLLLDVSTEIPTVRGVTSPDYTRIWNADICEKVSDVGGNWKLPLQYENGNWNGPLVPGGAYVGDRDFFLFMVDDEKRINDGSAEGLSRGFFLRNSEVGDGRALRFTRFWKRHVCGNNIVWGARDIAEIRVRHTGSADLRAFAEIKLALDEYANASAVDDEAAIAKARALLLGADEEQVVQAVVKATNCSQKLAAGAFNVAKEWESVDGAATSAWGMINGITRYAQLSKWTDERVEADAVAQQLFVKVLA